MSGTLIISLDFELMWGVRDHATIDGYGKAVLGVRKALPLMLERFNRFGIHATWATVGLLFARNRDEVMDHLPTIKPAYQNRAFSPYPYIMEGLGQNESDDPYHFGRSLVDRVAETPGQELGTHTFSHFYCVEPGSTLAAFEADVQAAVVLAGQSGLEMKSIVFPRNQMSQAHVEACVSQGIRIFRGNPQAALYRSRKRDANGLLVRAARGLDAVAPMVGRMDFPGPVNAHGAINVPASRFLRPWSARFPAYSAMHVRHVEREMRQAAEAGTCYHLWWHPHNMGTHVEANMAKLDALLETFRHLRDSHGMKSQSMAEAAQSATAGR